MGQRRSVAARILKETVNQAESGLRLAPVAFSSERRTLERTLITFLNDLSNLLLHRPGRMAEETVLFGLRGIRDVLDEYPSEMLNVLNDPRAKVVKAIRVLKPTACHPHRRHYARGLCQSCWRADKKQAKA